MSTTKEFVAYILDQIDDPKARARAMFGEYGLYYDDVIVALICDDTLFVKITEGTKKILGNDAEMGPPYPTAKPSYVIDERYIEDRKKLRELLKACAKDVQKTKKRKP
ncbi:TfoX/Sxy family protein [Candidatus Gracilibacteria bacterium]|nr:TfoX/Sxy family protein [Candidatus Gracilibacteria bacterium]